MANFAAWVMALFAVCASQVFAQSQLPQEHLHRMVDVYPSVQIAGMSLLPGADHSLRIEQIQVLPPESFKELPQRLLRVSDSTWDRSLWLKITLLTHEPVAYKQPSALSILEIQKPYLDQLALYVPKPGGGWQVQRSGDSLSKELWSLPGQFPRFILPSTNDLHTLPGGQMVVYLHVPHRMPASFDLKIVSAADLAEDIQRDYLLLGFTFGFMFLAVCLSVALFAFHRDTLFVWYAIYAFCALLACLSHSGLAFQYLWPWGGIWPSNAALFFSLIGAAAQLQFCKLMFTSSASRPWLVALCEWLGGIGVISALTLAAVGREYWITAIVVSQVMIMACLFLSCALIALACWRGNKFAMVSALIYFPLFIAVILVMANTVGLIALPEFGYNAPLYFVAMEVALLSLCLLWFGHHRHGLLERKNALDATDPLTGFATADAFQKRLQRDWHDPREQNQDMTVAYIELKTKANSRQHLEQLLKRSVRVLRSATRAQDMVARLDGQLLAIMLPQMGLGDDLSQLLSRIVALGLIPDRSDPKAPVLQFRIAATTRLQFNLPLAQLDTQLRELLARQQGWDSKAIRMINHLNLQAGNPNQVIDSKGLEDMWERAIEATEETPLPRSSPDRSTR